MMDLTGDTTGARIQPDQGFEHGVELLGHRLTMCSVQFAANLLGTDHDGIEAIEGLTPVLAEMPLEASIDAPVLRSMWGARRTRVLAIRGATSSNASCNAGTASSIACSRLNPCCMI